MSAADVADSEESASYFESFFAQTVDWGDFDVEIESSTLIEETESKKLSETLIKERYIRIGEKRIFVQSLRLAPIAGDESSKPTHRLTVTVLSDAVALQRTYPNDTNRFKMDGKNRTFEWTCNPPDFRLIGVMSFPFQGGSTSEEMIESLRKLHCAPDPAWSLVVKNGKAAISKSARMPGASAQYSYAFDIDRLLLTERQWRMEGGKNLVSGQESFLWEKIDGKQRPTRVIGEHEKAVHNNNGKLVQQTEKFEARYKWNEVNEKATKNQDELLVDAKKALEFLESVKEPAKD